MQAQVHTKVCRHANAILAGRPVLPFLINIDGTAGTGKSFLIDAISQTLDDLRPPELVNPLVRRLAPTGVAAFNIGGETYHSALRLKIGSDTEDHGIGDRLGALQEAWTGTCYLIIDEKSMIGRRAFGLMDRIFRQIFPHASHLPFGGLSVLLFGDFGQLPPVGDTPSFVTTLDRGTTYAKLLSNHGRQAYLAFNESIELTAIMRQSDSDDSTLAFKATLGRLREGCPSEDDYRLLSSRFWMGMTAAERQQFDGALYLAATKQMVHEINVDNLQRAQRPILRCVARSTGPGAERASEDEAGAAQVIYLMVGAKVMLSRNIWTAKGLTNGSMGVVDSILLAPGDSPQHCTPTVVMVSFASYSGPSQWHDHNGVPLVPIIPCTTTWEGTGGARCSRRQLPLRLAYAVTIHKSQGVTLDKVIINIGEREFNRGLTFVAVSRSKRLDGIAFRPGFTWERLQCLQPKQRSAATDNLRKAKADEERRRRLGFTLDPVFVDGGSSDGTCLTAWATLSSLCPS